MPDVGIAGATFEDWVTGEQVPELRWPHSNRVFARMEREDSRVSSLLAAINLPILRTTWRIDPNGAPDEVTEFVAKNMVLPIVGAAGDAAPLPRSRGRFSFAHHLLQVPNGLNVFGHAVYEQVYRWDDAAGKFWLHKLGPRPQHTIAEFKTARDGGLIAVVQSESGTAVLGVGTSLPVKRLVVYTRGMLPGQWQGRSLLRPSFKHWLLKDELIRYQAVAIRRNGMGVPIGTTPAEATQEEVNELAKIAQQYRGGDNAGAALPAGADLKLLGVQGNLPNIQQAIEYHDQMIAIAGLAHFLNLSGGGSYALASVQENTFVQSVQSFAESMRDTANAHIIEDLVDINFGPDVQAPRLVFDDIGSQQEVTAAALNLLVQAGLLVPDVMLEQAIRQRMSLPPASPGSASESSGEDENQ
ncbi:DUF935 family protein [Gordonia sp. NB41Y]|uniref:phage portal protein family protein n=1 Tax=Gordonia sp. NB41Y TaxID=875808 RepID=UPI00273B8420|nr:DUF935 family protein [Gordonia sp. NB41Y]WLP90248.1 DUF935 family protein [Gordonia sp. NB41Y]